MKLHKILFSTLVAAAATTFTATAFAADITDETSTDGSTTYSGTTTNNYYVNLVTGTKGETTEKTYDKLEGTLESGASVRNFSPIKIKTDVTATVTNGIVANINGTATNAIFGAVVNDGSSLTVNNGSATYAIELNLGNNGASENTTYTGGCGGIVIQDGGSGLQSTGSKYASGTVNGDIHVTVGKGKLSGWFFAGNRTWTNLAKSESDTTDYTVSSTISGQVFSEISGGTIGEYVGGGYYSSGTKATTGSTKVVVTGGSIDTVFGGDDAIGLGPTGAAGTVAEITGSTEVSVSGGTINYGIYGGGYLSDYDSHGLVKVSIGTGSTISVTNASVGGIVGGALLYAYKADGTNGTYTSSQGKLVSENKGAVTINLGAGATVSGSVYGGDDVTDAAKSGNGAAEASVGSVKIDIASGSKVSGSVYGGGYSTSSATSATVTGDVGITVSGGTVSGSVYGGGYGATSAVGGSVTVNVSGGTVGGIIGGGYRGTVGGNVAINVSDGTVGGIIGGGCLGSVTGNVEINITGGTVGDIYAGGYGSSATVGGDATVTISGKETVVKGKIYGCNDTVTGTSKLVLKDVSINLSVSGFDVILADSGASGNVTIDGGIASGTSVAVNANTTLTVSDSSDSVVLSSSAAFTVNKAQAIATTDVSLPNAGDTAVTTLAAWAFDITKTADTDEVTVTLQLPSGLDGDAIRVYHKADTDGAAWEDYSSSVTEKTYDKTTGTLKFKTKSFSSYAAGTTQVIPEPSAFGLLAGIGALALAIARRKRRK